MVQSVEADVHVFYASEIIENDLWSDELFQKKLQKGEDLGARMSHAFTKLLSDYDKVVIVGSDCPQLTKEHIDSAFKSLQETDIVIGPTYDGGYYLLGMKHPHSFLFTDMKWSTDEVFSTSMKRIFEQEHTLTQLQMLSDIDVEDDLKYMDWL